MEKLKEGFRGRALFLAALVLASSVARAVEVTDPSMKDFPRGTVVSINSSLQLGSIVMLQEGKFFSEETVDYSKDYCTIQFRHFDPALSQHRFVVDHTRVIDFVGGPMTFRSVALLEATEAQLLYVMCTATGGGVPTLSTLMHAFGPGLVTVKFPSI